MLTINTFCLPFNSDLGISCTYCTVRTMRLLGTKFHQLTSECLEKERIDLR